MPTLALTVRLPEALHERLIAELADLGFDAFEERHDGVVAYAPAARWDGTAREALEAWLEALGLVPDYGEEVLPDENWNARWEASIEPQPVGPFLVTPSWKPVPPEHADRIVLTVDPKMAFGTGYHASTRLALRFLPGLVRGGERVLDAGTGTGILALAALRLGAASALGFDIDPWARVNAEENAARNGLADRFTVREGSLEVVPEEPFDLVLANIDRPTLLTMLPALADRLVPGGRLVLAGLLHADREDLCRAIGAVGLVLQEEAAEDGWWSAVATRPEPSL